MTEPSKYLFNHSMIRVKDPKKSVAFYEHLGLSVIDKKEFPDNTFDLYFLAYDGPKAVSHKKARSDREGIIELTHNYGTEDKEGQVYHNGNDEPQGFGHTCITVDNIQAACKRISDAGYTFKKKLEDGRMHNIAFLLDPDNYWVEIIASNPADQTENVKETDPGVYCMNHTMIRVKDQDVSIKFYTETMGMTLMRQNELKGADATLSFLGYGAAPTDDGGTNPGPTREGLLELTYNHGTEKKEGKVYSDGNSDPQGFGHICVSVDDIDKACERFEQKGVTWKKKLTDGRMRNIAFVLDPDGYWIEVIQNESMKSSSKV